MPESNEPVVDALRGLIDAVRTADPSEVDRDAVAAAIEATTAMVAPHFVDQVRTQATLFSDELADRIGDPEGRRDRLAQGGLGQVFPYSPYLGARNPLAPPARLDTVEIGGALEVRGEVTLADAYNGPPGSVHGGVIAGLLDEVLGGTCVVNDIGGFTGTLTVRYRSPTPLRTRLALRGWVERVLGRKAFARGTIHHDELLLAEAEGVFIAAGPLPNPV